MTTEFQQHILEQTVSFVQKQLADDTTGHDWWHINRVHQNAKFIAEQEGANTFVVELAALLHDIADWKLHDGDQSVGPVMAGEFLLAAEVDQAVIEQVCDIIATLSFKGAGVDSTMKTVEGQVVQDADRLDALGAIGIARAFAYGGHFDRPLYDPNNSPVMHQSAEEYLNSSGATINHFYEKLLLLKDLMNTETGKILAEERHRYLETFLEQFYSEWNGPTESSHVQ